MNNYSIHERHELPANMQVLLHDYPRGSWHAHSHFSRCDIDSWMGAHRSFKRVAKELQNEAELCLDNAVGSEDLVRTFSHYGGSLVSSLHGHHSWEDRFLFPDLMLKEKRIQHGLDMLESDHVELDSLLNQLTQSTNDAARSMKNGVPVSRDDVGKLQQRTEALGQLLTRHLGDEEDLIVPVVLHRELIY